MFKHRHLYTDAFGYKVTQFNGTNKKVDAFFNLISQKVVILQ